MVSRAQIEAQAVTGAAQLRDELNAGAGALLVMEEALEGAVLAAVMEHLAGQPPWSDLPILVLSRRGLDSPGMRKIYQDLGNVTLLERPVQIAIQKYFLCYIRSNFSMAAI